TTLIWCVCAPPSDHDVNTFCVPPLVIGEFTLTVCGPGASCSENGAVFVVPSTVTGNPAGMVWKVMPVRELKLAVTVFGASIVTVVDALLGDATLLPDQFANTNCDAVDVTEIGTEV